MYPPYSSFQIPHRPHSIEPEAIKYYLIAYNVVSFIAWLSILALTVTHIASPALSHPPPPHTPQKPSFLSSILPFKSTSAHPPSPPSAIPAYALPFYQQLLTTYSRVGKETTYAVSLAGLEVVHAFLGWVRSPVKTTALQVSGRAFITWVIVRNFAQVLIPFPAL
jgi:very-long-chain (3R)-3-hydroxyacyl-CoA dehydratase